MFVKIGEFLASLPKELYVFLISIMPIIELRGAIPVGAALGVPFYVNYLLSVTGNLLPVPLILVFIPKILDFLGRFKFFAPMVNWLRKKAEKNKGKIIKDVVSESTEDGLSDGESAEKHLSDGESAEKCLSDGESIATEVTEKAAKISTGAFLGLMLFVAIPLPGTGAWTGSLVAALFGLPKRSSLLAVTLGVLICGVIMCLASYGILGFLSFLL